ncbi:hypothetical protein CLOM_g9755 [Closterium sp. NIES-68]|nr:hypothetical protein CLOM_g9755 [Closterium sp. NIES-68]
MLRAPASPSAETALHVNASSRVICKRVVAPSLSRPAILQSALNTIQDQTGNGGGSAWMPNLVDAQRSPAVSNPSSPLSAAHGMFSVQQQSQQQLQQLLVTIGQSVNAVSQAAAQFVNAASSVNPASFPANHINQKRQAHSSVANPAGQQSAADAVVNMILRKIAGDASSFQKHPAAAAESNPASSKSDVSVEPFSAAALSPPLLDASSRPSSAAIRRPSLLSAPTRALSAVVPTSVASAGSFPANSGASLQQVVPGSQSCGAAPDSDSDDDMVLAYLHAQGQAQMHAQAEAKAEGMAEAQAHGNVEQQAQQAAKLEVMASDAADMTLLLQLHEEVMVLEKLVAAGAVSTATVAKAAAASPSAAAMSALAPLPRAADFSLPCAAPDAALPRNQSLSHRPDTFLEQMSSAPGRMLFGFSPVYDLMAPGGAWGAHAAAAGMAGAGAGDVSGWDLRDLVDASSFDLGAPAAFLA